MMKPQTLDLLRKGFQGHDIPYKEVFVIPFSEELPELNLMDACPIFYGSTTLILNAYKHPEYRKGVFYNPDTFQMAMYLDQWKDYLLNADGFIIPFRELITARYPAESHWFIRPNTDTKSFSGTVMSFMEIQAWAGKIALIDNPELSLDSLLFISSPKTIAKEWRNFIVNGKVVSSSRYQVNGELSLSAEDIPAAMIEFTEVRCTEFTPNDIFVMDVALAEGRFGILECNCFNGTGFYAHDISNIIRTVTDAIIRTVTDAMAEKC
jgi:hypothetical protein